MESGRTGAAVRDLEVINSGTLGLL